MNTNRPTTGEQEKTIRPEELRPYLREYVEQITGRKGAGYVCPLCGSGNGPKGTAAFSIQDNGERWKCFSCGQGGDLFDLIGLHKEIPGFRDQVAEAWAELRGPWERAADRQPRENGTAAPGLPAARNEPEAAPVDFTPFIKLTQAAIGDTDYPQARGFSAEAAARHGFGFYDGRAEQKAAITALMGYDPIKQPALIIPYPGTAGYYTARPINPAEGGQKYLKPKRDKAGREPLFNIEALYNREGAPVFITEGQLDALSIIEAGGQAVAAAGANHRRLLEAIKDKQPKATLIIATDNDGPGKAEADTLAAELQKVHQPHIKADLYSAAGVKDANDLLQQNPEGLREAVGAAIMEAWPERKAYLTSSAAHKMQGFLDGITESVNTPCISTGFKELDSFLDGGLYEGLYTVGAISSMGKTTFALQIADQIAGSGTDVLFITLEMAASEIMAKSISRLTFEHCGGYPNNAKTARGILDGKRHKRYNTEEVALIHKAITEYHKSPAPFLYFIEGVGNVGVDQVRKEVEKHIRHTGRRPVVVIDYLQILAPHSDRATDKQNTDKAVLELKRISRDHKTPVIAISSFNRASYSGHVSMEAFKESGAIEYSADVVIGLQPEGMKSGSRKNDENANKAQVFDCKAKNSRQLEAVILKNRNGQTHTKAKYTYDARFNHFREMGAADFIEDEEGPF